MKRDRDTKDDERLPTIVGYLIGQGWFELALVAVFTGGFLFDPIVGAVLVAVATLPAHVRGPILRRLHSDSVRRRWTLAVISSGAADPPPDRSHKHRSYVGPRPSQGRAVPVGDILELRSRTGFDLLERSAPQIAAHMGVRQVKIKRHPNRANRATATLIRRDAWEAGIPMRWPLAQAETVSMWDPVPVGVDENLRPVNISLVERNVLVGGEPGGGKSVFLSLIAAAAALDPETKLWVMDPKEVELSVWAPCAHRSIGPDKVAAARALSELRDLMDARYQTLQANGTEKVRREDGMPLHVLIVDELAEYVVPVPNDDDDKRVSIEISVLLRKIVAKGRAAGIIAILATQKPHGDVIDTNLRDLLGFRAAFRCNAPQHSDTILGQGWAASGYNAQRIPAEQKGVGWLLAEGDMPVLVKGYMIDRGERKAIASRAASNRMDSDAAEFLGTAGPDLSGMKRLTSTAVLEPETETETPPVDTAKRNATEAPADAATYEPEDANALLLLLADHPGLDRHAIADRIGRKHKTWWVALRQLVADGDILREGRGVKGSPYRYSIRAGSDTG